MYCNKGIRRQGRRSRGRGFSLVEIMVVIIIIGLLAGAVAYKVGDYVNKARVNRAKSDISAMHGAIAGFEAENGRYPTNDEGLDVLPMTIRNDPWGRPYVYNCPGRNAAFEVICLGADGREGGAADTPAADIGYDDLNTKVRETPK